MWGENILDKEYVKDLTVLYLFSTNRKQIFKGKGDVRGGCSFKQGEGGRLIRGLSKQA